jgi:hypothetical protein
VRRYGCGFKLPLRGGAQDLRRNAGRRLNHENRGWQSGACLERQAARTLVRALSRFGRASGKTRAALAVAGGGTHRNAGDVLHPVRCTRLREKDRSRQTVEEQGEDAQHSGRSPVRGAAYAVSSMAPACPQRFIPSISLYFEP